MRLAGSHLVLLTLLLWPLVTRAQPLPAQQEVPATAQAPHSLMDEEVGLPFFFEHFTPQEYRQHHQNWAVVQDPRGVIYVANYDGILEYDGASWRLIETPTKTIVRSLDVDAEGRIYAGVQGDFGYLQPDTTGILRFVSLRAQVDPAHRDFWDVWRTYVTGEGVYFQSSYRLFRWDGEGGNKVASGEEEGDHGLGGGSCVFHDRSSCLGGCGRTETRQGGWWEGWIPRRVNGLWSEKGARAGGRPHSTNLPSRAKPPERRPGALWECQVAGVWGVVHGTCPPCIRPKADVRQGE